MNNIKAVKLILTVSAMLIAVLLLCSCGEPVKYENKTDDEGRIVYEKLTDNETGDVYVHEFEYDEEGRNTLTRYNYPEGISESRYEYNEEADTITEITTRTVDTAPYPGRNTELPSWLRLLSYSKQRSSSGVILVGGGISVTDGSDTGVSLWKEIEIEAPSECFAELITGNFNFSNGYASYSIGINGDDYPYKTETVAGTYGDNWFEAVLNWLGSLFGVVKMEEAPVTEAYPVSPYSEINEGTSEDGSSTDIIATYRIGTEDSEGVPYYSFSGTPVAVYEIATPDSFNCTRYKETRFDDSWYEITKRFDDSGKVTLCHNERSDGAWTETTYNYETDDGSVETVTFDHNEDGTGTQTITITYPSGEWTERVNSYDANGEYIGYTERSSEDETPDD
ncbi:MAG: hypothetical protein IJS71_06655 [Clostridia bacterium]|nr:hypothetical protein [Clostridia bacterium]